MTAVTATAAPMTGPQRSYIASLYAQRQVPDGGRTDREAFLLERAWDATFDQSKFVGKREASDVIDWLLTLPRKTDPAQPERGQAQRSGQAAAVGVYQRDGRIYVVREFTPDGETQKVRYARELVELTPGQGDRMNGDGDHVRYEERKAPRMQFELTAADAMPTEDVKRLSQKYRRCIVCGTRLEVAESIERGIGPVCYGRQQQLTAA